MTCFGTGLRKLFFVCVIAAFGVIAVSSGFGLGILLAVLALVAPYKCKIPHFLFSARIVVSDAGKSPKSLGLSRSGILARLCQSRRCDMARSGRCACI